MEARSSETEPRQVTVANGNLSALHQKIINESNQLMEDSRSGSNADEDSLGHFLGPFETD